MEGITKSFSTVTANKDVSFHVHAGETLGLLGENGAGKTTLMNILYGLYQPDSGHILINNKPVVIRNSRDSMHLGIGMVHQHFMLVQNHTVGENIALGYSESPFVFPARAVRKKIREFSAQYGLKTDPDKKVWQLSAGEQQRVEIVKTLFHGADVLILDEPTSVLTPRETDELFDILRRMKQEGHAVILISHKLEEILTICNRAVVLRRGEVIGSADIKDVRKKDLARMMVGRDVVFSFSRKPVKKGPVILNVTGITVRGDRNETAVDRVSFDIHGGEIFGIAGVSGNGQKELVEAVTGLRKVESGTIEVEDLDIANTSARFVHDRGVGHVPEERMKFGIIPNLFLFDNAVLKQHHARPFSNLLFLDYRHIRSYSRKLVEDFQVSTPSIDSRIKALSGGNIQKLILGREISRQPKLLVASHPTYGLDVGATEYIRNQLLSLREKGGGVLLISEDLEEIIELCDRTAVMFEGKIMGILDPRKTDIGKIGLMMAGSS